MAILKQSTAYTRMFVMISSTDHISPATGQTVSVNLSKAGATGAAAGGSVSEVDSTHMPGWYKIALTTTDTNTLGDLAYHCTGSAADPTDFVDQICGNILGDTLPVNAIQINGISAGSVASIAANIGTTQPFNFTGTGASAFVQSDLQNIGGAALGAHAAGMVPADVRDIAGSAVNTASAQLGVNAVNIGGHAVSLDGNNLLEVDVADWNGTAVSSPATAGIPDVNVKNWNNHTAQTDANNLPKVDLEDIAGNAVSTSSAQLGVNTVNIAGQAAVLDGNNLLKVDVEAVNGNTAAAQNVSKANQAIGRGTCAGGGSTTSIPTSAFSLGGSGVVSGQFDGRTIIFDANTTTASLRGQGTAIIGNTAGANPTFTVAASTLTTVPAAGDTFGVY